MKWAFFFLALFSASVQAYDVVYSCEFPTTRENGDALALSEIESVLLRYVTSEGQEIIVVDDDGTCGGDVVGLPDGPTTFNVATVDTSGFHGGWGDPFVVNNTGDPLDRILGQPGLSFVIVPTAIDPEPPIEGGEVMAKVVIEEADILRSNNASNDGAPGVSHQAYVSGDLLIQALNIDDDITAFPITTPTAGPNGETLILNTTGSEGSATSGPSQGVIAWVGDATVSAGTLAWAISGGGQQWEGRSIKIPAGEFDATTPLGAVSGYSGNTSTSGSTIATPAWTAGATDGDADGSIVVFLAADYDPIGATPPSGWTILSNFDGGAIAAGVGQRTAAVTNSESIASVDYTLASDSSSTIGIIVRAPTAGGTTLAIQDSTHGHITDAVPLTQSNVLTVSESGHSHTVEGITLIQKSALSVDESSHSHSADNVGLSQSTSLGVVDTSHLQNVDSLALSQAASLSVAGSAHSHNVNNVVLSQSAALGVNGSAHSHNADNIILTVAGSLAVQAAIHSHTSDNLSLIQDGSLSIQEALHSIGSDNVALSQSVYLSVFDATHSHTADGVVLTHSQVATVQDALHAVSSDQLALTSNVTLIVSDTLHAHIADQIFMVSGDTVTPAWRTLGVPFESREFVIPFENRIFIVRG